MGYSRDRPVPFKPVCGRARHATGIVRIERATDFASEMAFHGTGGAGLTPVDAASRFVAIIHPGPVRVIRL